MISRSQRCVPVCRSKQHAHDGRGHEIGHGTGEHGADAELRELAALLGSQRADTADLNPDGTEIGEAAEGEGGDRKGTRVEGSVHGAELLEGDEFVDDHAGAEEIADRCSVVPGDTDQPSDGSKDPTKNLLQAGGKPRNTKVRQAVVDSAHDSVGQRYQCQDCHKTFSVALQPKQHLNGMTTPMDKALQALAMLLEGCSIRSVERLTQLHRDTITRLLVLAGERCEKRMGRTLMNVPVQDVQCDEIWGFVGKKQRHVEGSNRR